jgi:tetratricopeptide (TPR) repeat protein
MKQIEVPEVSDIPEKSKPDKIKPEKIKNMFRRVFLIILYIVISFSSSALKKVSSTDIENAGISAGKTLSESQQRIFDHYFSEALNLKYKGKLTESFQLFSFCTKLDSLNPQPWYELALYYNGLKMSDLSLKAIKKAYELDKKNEWYILGLANMYISQGKTAEAIVLYENLSKLKPDDENLLFQLSSLYAQNNNGKVALERLNSVERLIGKNEAVSFEKYKIYKQEGKVKKAIKEIESLVGEFPYDVDYILLLGDAWMDLGYPEKALPKYMEASKMDPNNPSVPLSLADYYNNIGDSLSAKKQLRLALTNPNTDFDTKMSIFQPIIVSSLKNSDSTELSKYFDVLLEQHPTEYQLRELHVQWLMERGKKQEAKDELRNVLDLNPNQLQAWKNYLQLNLEYDNQEVIRQLCNEALEYFPNESIFWFYLGLSWTSENEGKVKDKAKSLKGIEYFKKAIEVADSKDLEYTSRLYGLMGDAYLLMNDTVQAYGLYEQALDKYPGNILVLNNYAYYLSITGSDLSKAERMSRKTIDADPNNATFLDTFAWIYFKLEKFGLAKIYIERAIKNEKNPGHELLEHYGDILWFNSEKEAARVQWKKAAELEDPSETLLKKVETGEYCK